MHFCLAKSIDRTEQPGYQRNISENKFKLVMKLTRNRYSSFLTTLQTYYC